MAHEHEHGAITHEHARHEHAHHQDLNVRAAYLHVLADAATSVLAIVALLGGKLWGLAWLDPVMGLAGAVLVAVWAQGLLRDSGRVLLDAEMDAPVVREVREVIEHGTVPARITDLHVWRVGRAKYACVVSLTTPSQMDGDYFRARAGVHEELAHVTVEVDHAAGSEKVQRRNGILIDANSRSTSSWDGGFFRVLHQRACVRCGASICRKSYMKPRSSTPRRKPAQVVCTGNRCEASRTLRSASSTPSMARLAMMPTPRPSRTYFLMTSESQAVSATLGFSPSRANRSTSDDGPEKLNE